MTKTYTMWAIVSDDMKGIDKNDFEVLYRTRNDAIDEMKRWFPHHTKVVKAKVTIEI